LKIMNKLQTNNHKNVYNLMEMKNIRREKVVHPQKLLQINSMIVIKK